MLDEEMLIGTIEHRLDYIRNEAEQGKNRMQDPCHKQFWEGKVSAHEGVLGEINFLEKLLKQIKENKNELGV